MWFIFFDILWLIICDSNICFSFELLFVIQLLISFEFYIKNIYLFSFSEFISIWLILKLVFFYFFFMIKYNKQVDKTNPFNEWIVLGLRNPDPFNKYVGLGLTHIAKNSHKWTQHKPNTRTQIAIPSHNTSSKKSK